MQLIWKNYSILNDFNLLFVPHKSGVYKLSLKYNNGFIPFYVGQTRNLNDRMGQYNRKETNNSCVLSKLTQPIVYFSVAEVEYQVDRDIAEKTLFEHYKRNKLCNDPSKIPNVVSDSEMNYQ